jgi:hypothetical protein
MKKKFERYASNPKDNALFNLLCEQQYIHPAVKYFEQLYGQLPTPQLAQVLSRFAEPKVINHENFVEGVKQFIALANSNPLGQGSNRQALYGTIYSGLHYDNELITLWNTQHPNQKPLNIIELTALSPIGWDSIVQEGFVTLIYKGQQPAQALDNLVKGPTIIDCGIFTQLSLWFGIRYMLGNERFNQCFGRAPFFLTQISYSDIQDKNKPFLGNPLYSFLVKKERATIPSVTVKNFSNTLLYRLKHPGGNYGSENCIMIGDQYYIFDPHLEQNQGMTEASILNLLREAFNESIRPYEMNRLSLYAATSEQFNPHFSHTHGQLIEKANVLRDKTLSEEEFSRLEQNPELELVFDLHQFSIWLQRVENALPFDAIDYVPQAIDHSLLPTQLLAAIPFENRTSMDFSKFKQESPQQKELMILSQQFCQSIMVNESKLVILTGKAGVGKTAAAVCAAKELTARGKHVAWISEVMVRGWLDQAKSFAEVGNCGQEIDRLLASDPNAIFLDDDNLAGLSGQLLLEKIYSWFVNTPGKGLFITSNQPIHFKDCYGYKLDGKYYFPPFNDYSSAQYLNWQHKADLTGASLRSRCAGQSIGAIVSDLAWKAHERNLGPVELIPAFDDSAELAPIRRSLRTTGSLNCSAYDKLRPVQKQWIHVHQAANRSWFANGRMYDEPPYLIANPLKFENTTCNTIALEIKDCNTVFSSGKEIASDSMDQLIRVLNYAHDQGGRRIILINQTSYSTEQLLIQIKAQLPKSESERTWSRLVLLLCETEDSIFSHAEFNEHNRITGVEPVPLSTADFFADPRFFSNLKLTPLINKYKLADTTQASLEKGLRNAAVNGNVEDLKIFIQHVNNVNAIDANPNSQKTALDWAIKKGHTLCCELLIAAGAVSDIQISRVGLN